MQERSFARLSREIDKLSREVNNQRVLISRQVVVPGRSQHILLPSWRMAFAKRFPFPVGANTERGWNGYDR